MKEYMVAVLSEVDRGEMLELRGGDGTGFFVDLGYAVGYAFGCISRAAEFINTNPPVSYAYGKVGYSS